MINRPVYWECKEDGHDKFWAAQITEIMVTDPKYRTGDYTRLSEATSSEDPSMIKKYLLVRKWGAINTKGQKMEMLFDSLGQAEIALQKLNNEKENKGYHSIF